MNKKISIVMVIAIIVVALVATSCGSTASKTDKGITLDYGTKGEMFGLHTITPAKDFNGVGLVFTEQSFKLNPEESFNGETYTYQKLLQEAQKLGADAIINVVVDYRIINETSTSTETSSNLFSSSSSSSGSFVRTETWYGSALAIKYTNALKNDSNVSRSIVDGVITTVTTSSDYILNEGTSPGSGSSSRSAAPTAGTGDSSSSGSSGGGLFGGLFGGR